MNVIKRLLDKDAISGDVKQVPPSIICSTHQPSFECLKLFDQIYLLSECGEKMFCDSPLSVPSYLISAGMALPDHCNPADCMLDLCYRQVSASDADKECEGAKSGEAGNLETRKLILIALKINQFRSSLNQKKILIQS